jgi:glyoxylase-like metal-dependent hydrolase (beta-lactamase superfamily II)
MKVTLLGHASLLLELDGANVLMDPVFQDPFQDGAVVACPQREIFVDRLPRIDKVVISHAHLDHFDLRSLDRLPRHLEVLCPQDPVLPYALGKLGFKNVRTLAANQLVDFGSWQILTTYSDVDVIEVGSSSAIAPAACWNEVDSVVNPRRSKPCDSRWVTSTCSSPATRARTSPSSSRCAPAIPSASRG